MRSVSRYKGYEIIDGGKDVGILVYRGNKFLMSADSKPEAKSMIDDLPSHDLRGQSSLRYVVKVKLSPDGPWYYISQDHRLLSETQVTSHNLMSYDSKNKAHQYLKSAIRRINCVDSQIERYY